MPKEPQREKSGKRRRGQGGVGQGRRVPSNASSRLKENISIADNSRLTELAAVVSGAKGMQQQPTAELREFLALYARRPSGTVKIEPRRSFGKRPANYAVDEIPTSGFEPPRWVKAFWERGVDEREILDKALERIKRAPSHENYLTAKLLANKIGREPNGAAELNKRLTKEIIFSMLHRATRS
jgi:hypothetical protein